MKETKKKEFVKPELTKFDKSLDEVTLCNYGSGHEHDGDGRPHRGLYGPS